jgi:carbamoyl-phosphate synthase large subunit
MPLLGPEMKSTGEVMGVGATFAEAFVKSSRRPALGCRSTGKAFISVKQSRQDQGGPGRARTGRTGLHAWLRRAVPRRQLRAAGLQVTPVNKVTEGRPHIVDMIKNGEISFICNTVDERRTAIADSRSIRTGALAGRVTLYTTVEGALAACAGMRHLQGLEAYALQALHAELA